MRKIYEKEWFGIDFKSFAVLDSKRLADINFYGNFYDKFYKRFNSYEELPDDWKTGKRLVADFILQQANSQDRLLSIGCGNGYIEYLLRKKERNITAIEPSLKATEFLKRYCDLKLYNGYFPQCLKDADDTSFDLAYMSATEYCFSDNELLNLLKEIRHLEIKSFILISVSIYKASPVRLLKDTAKLLLSNLGLRDLDQFWGYSRTPKEFAYLFKTAGFQNIESGFLKDNIFWIKCVNKDKYEY